MASKQTVHMNPGQGETSYARNSTFQNNEQNRMKPLIEEAIADLCRAPTTLPSRMVIADLGCSSGPNATMLVSAAVDAICRHYLQLQQPPPELCVLLNDLPDNDFNTVSKSLAAFRQSREDSIAPLVTGILPGSFYTRLFTSGSLHLVCSSNSLQWLSEAPEDLVKNGIPAYDSDEQVRRARRPTVVDAYARQFRKDFTQFLGLRAQEMVPGGRMVLSLIGRRSSDTRKEETIVGWEHVASVLNDMASRGVIAREKFNSFYMPTYAPCNEEVREIIEAEGSFSIGKMHESSSDVGKELITPKMIAYTLRAAYEPLIEQHFGSGEVMDEFVRTIEQLLSSSSLQDVLDKNPRVFVVASLTKRI